MRQQLHIIHESVRMLTRMLTDETQRSQLAQDQNLAKYLLLCLPYLSYYLVEKLLDILLEISKDDKPSLRQMHENIEQIMGFQSPSAAERQLQSL